AGRLGWGILLVTGLAAAVAYSGQLQRERVARVALRATSVAAPTDEGRDWGAALLLPPDPHNSSDDDPFWQWSQQMKNGDLARQKGDPARALKCFEMAAAATEAEFQARIASAKRKGENVDSWPAMRRNWCLSQSRLRVGDVLCEMGRLEEAAKSYTAAAATLD